MQRIERYGVIALVFLLVTIVAVSLWGERKKGDGLFAFLKRDESSARVDELVADARAGSELRGQEIAARDASDRMLDLSSWSGRGAAPHASSGPVDPYSAELKRSPYGNLQPTETPRESASILPQAEIPTSFDVQTPQAEVRPQARPQERILEPTPEASASSTSAAARSYTVRARDTLSEIAQRELGTSRRWREIVELNPGLDPARLVVGKQIRLPAGEATSPERSQPRRREEPRESTPKLAAALPEADANYAIRPGDTLSEISQTQLGTSKRWRDIVALNPGLNPSRLEVGQVITLPAPDASQVLSNSVAAAKPKSSKRRVR